MGEHEDGDVLVFAVVPAVDDADEEGADHVDEGAVAGVEEAEEEGGDEDGGPVAFEVELETGLEIAAVDEFFGDGGGEDAEEFYGQWELGNVFDFFAGSCESEKGEDPDNDDDACHRGHDEEEEGAGIVNQGKAFFGPGEEGDPFYAKRV